MKKANVSGSRGRATSGGGSTSNKLTKPSIKTGNPAKGVNPGHVSYTGSKLGNHATNSGGKKLENFTPHNTNPPTNAGAPLGNEVALRASGAKAGPGADRQVMRSGTQGTHGPANSGNPMKPSADIWSSFPGPNGNVKR
jgi:hypothetical protein